MASTMTESRTVAVVGGGPAGAMIALLLAQRGYAVEIFEKRPDFRATIHASEAGAEVDKTFGQSRDAAKRSINLALSVRGQSALQAAGVLDEVMAQVVPMPCRAVHTPTGSLVSTPYGLPGQSIYSVSRGLLNRVLVDAAEARGVVLHFGAAFVSLEVPDGQPRLTVRLSDGSQRVLQPLLVVGADGAYSGVRGAMARFTRQNFARRFLDHGYKELVIPAAPSGGYALPNPHALHIWPRSSFMLIGLPNPDKSFTMTVFAPMADLEALDGKPERIGAWFAGHFPDASALLPDVQAQWASNPTSTLVDVRVSPITARGRVILVGDAAHSTSPFYGQGMNAALEDCLVFAEALDAAQRAAGGSLAAPAASPAAAAAAAGGGGATAGASPASPADASLMTRAVALYQERRQPAGEALCELSLANYLEMRHKTASPLFRARFALENWLHSVLPQRWIPLYSMVAFTRIPYHEVRVRAAKQHALLDGFLHAALAGAALAGTAFAVSLARDRGYLRPLGALLEPRNGRASRILAAVAGALGSASGSVRQLLGGGGR